MKVPVGRSLLVELPEGERITGYYTYDASKVKVRLFRQKNEPPGRSLRNKVVIEALKEGYGEVFLITDGGSYVLLVETGNFLEGDVYLKLRNARREAELLFGKPPSFLTPKEFARFVFEGRAPLEALVREEIRTVYLPPFLVYFMREVRLGRFRGYLVKVANYDTRKSFDFGEIKRRVLSLFEADEVYVFFERDDGTVYPIRLYPEKGSLTFVVVEVIR